MSGECASRGFGEPPREQGEGFDSARAQGLEKLLGQAITPNDVLEVVSEPI